MDDYQEAQERIIENIIKSGSINSVNAHFLSLVTKALNGKHPKKSHLGQLLTPIKPNNLLSTEIANEIVFDFLQRFSLNHSLATMENETKKTISCHHGKNWILDQLKFSNTKETVINQLIHQHTDQVQPNPLKSQNKNAGKKTKGRITKGAKKKSKGIPTIAQRDLNQDSQSSVDQLGSSAVPTGFNKNDWEETKLRTMESQSESSSSVNLSDLQPQYTIDSFGNNVERAIGELVLDQDFENMHDSSSYKGSPNSQNKTQGDSLQSAFSESSKEQERKNGMIQAFESESNEIEELLNNNLKEQLNSSSSSKKKKIKKSKKDIFDKMSQSSAQNLSELPLTQMSSDYIVNAAVDKLATITKDGSSNSFSSVLSSSKEYSDKSSSRPSNNLHEAPVLDEDNYKNQKDALAETFKPKEIKVDDSLEENQIEEEESDSDVDNHEIQEEESESDNEPELNQLSTSSSEPADQPANLNVSSLVGVLAQMDETKDEVEVEKPNESLFNSSDLHEEEEEEAFLPPLSQKERNIQSESDKQSPSQHESEHLSSHTESNKSASQNEDIAQVEHDSNVQQEAAIETSSQYSKPFYSSSTEKENPLFENIKNVILVSTESEYTSEESENDRKSGSADARSQSSSKDLRPTSTEVDNKPANETKSKEAPKKYKFQPAIEITNVADFPYHSSRHSAVSRDIEDFHPESKSEENNDNETKSSEIPEPKSSVISENKSSVKSQTKSEKQDDIEEYYSNSYERNSVSSKVSSEISQHRTEAKPEQYNTEDTKDNNQEVRTFDLSDEESEFTRDFNNVDMSPWSKPTSIIKPQNDSDSEIDTIIDTIAGSPSPMKTPKHLIRKTPTQKPKEEVKNVVEEESYEEESVHSTAPSHSRSVSSNKPNSQHSSVVESIKSVHNQNEQDKSESSSIKSSKMPSSKVNREQQPIQQAQPSRNNKSESSSVKSLSKNSIASSNQQPVQQTQTSRNNKSESSSVKSTSKHSIASSNQQQVSQNPPLKNTVARSESSSSRYSMQSIDKQQQNPPSIKSIQSDTKSKSRENSQLSNQIDVENSAHSSALSNTESYSNAFSQEYNGTKAQKKPSAIKKQPIDADENTIDDEEFIEEEEELSNVVQQKQAAPIQKNTSYSRTRPSKPKSQKKRNQHPPAEHASSKHSSIIEQAPSKHESPKKDVERHMPEEKIENDIPIEEEIESNIPIEEEEEVQNEVQLSNIEEEHQLNVPSEFAKPNQSSLLSESESSTESPPPAEQLSPHVFKRPMIMNQYRLNQTSGLRRIPKQNDSNEDSNIESNQYAGNLADPFHRKAAKLPKVEKKQSVSSSPVQSQTNEISAYESTFSFEFANTKSKKPVKPKADNRNPANSVSNEKSDIIDRSIDIESASNSIPEINEEIAQETPKRILKSSLKNKPARQPKSRYQPVSHSPYSITSSRPATNQPTQQSISDNSSVKSMSSTASKNRDVRYDAMTFSEFFETVVNDNRSQNGEIRQPGIPNQSGLQSSSTSVVSNHISENSESSSESLFSKEFNEAKVVRFHHPKVRNQPQSEEASDENVQEENNMNEEKVIKEEQNPVEIASNEIEEEEYASDDVIPAQNEIEKASPVEQDEIQETNSAQQNELLNNSKESNQIQKNDSFNQPIVKKEAIIKEADSVSSQSGFSEEFDQNKKKILRPISHKTEKFTLKPKEKVEQKPKVQSSASSQISEPNSSSSFSEVFTKTKTKASKQPKQKTVSKVEDSSAISDILAKGNPTKSNEPSINSESSTFSNNFEKAKPSKTKRRIHKKKNSSSHSSVISNENPKEEKTQNKTKEDDQSFSNVFAETNNKKPKVKKQPTNNKNKQENKSDLTISSIDVSEEHQLELSGLESDQKKIDDENSLSSIHSQPKNATNNVSDENSMKSYSSDQFIFTPKTKAQNEKPREEIHETTPVRTKVAQKAQPKKQITENSEKNQKPNKTTNNKKKEQVALTIDVSLNSSENEDLQFDIPSPTDQKRVFNTDLAKNDGSNKDIEAFSDLSINSGIMNDSLIINENDKANAKKNSEKTFSKSNVKTIGNADGSNVDVVIELDDNSEY